MIVHVHPGYANLHLISDTVYLRRSFANQSHMLLMEMIIIIRHGTKPDKPLHGILKLNEHTEVRHAADNAWEFLPNFVQHELRFLQLLGIALCIDRHTLALGGLLSDIMHTACQILRSLLR
ncbi:hypothetical protein D3C80_1550200 [compost metagenome]